MHKGAEAAQKARELFSEAAKQMQKRGVGGDAITSALLATAIQAVIRAEGRERAVEWLRDCADQIEREPVRH